MNPENARDVEMGTKGIKHLSRAVCKESFGGFQVSNDGSATIILFEFKAAESILEISFAIDQVAKARMMLYASEWSTTRQVDTVVVRTRTPPRLEPISHLITPQKTSKAGRKERHDGTASGASWLSSIAPVT
eukprot:scaffold25410_cov117-Cylindrotheca_fusiformis.AAC.4